MTGDVVRIDNLTVRYGANGTGREALRNVSFSVDGGETLVILGPNGSGKSTLLHAIAGAIEGALLTGDIQILGRRVLEEPRHRRARSVAMVHQDPSRGTAAHLTLREHCELTSAMAGRHPVTWNQMASRLNALRTTLDSKQLAGELSGGQRQLFTLLLAVLSAPRVLLLDEPTSALDARHAALVLEVVREFSGPETATIMVTHDLSEARRIGDRLLVLNALGEAEGKFDPSEKRSMDDAALRDVLTRAASAAWTQTLAHK